MARVTYEETFDVWFVPTVADISAPTVIEVNAGTYLSCFLSKDGFDPGISNNSVDSKVLCTRNNGKLPGPVDASPTMTGFRDDATDTFWDLISWGQTGYIVALPFGKTVDPVVGGEKAMVFQGAFSERAPAGTSEATQQTFTVEFPSINWDLDAEITV